MKSRLVYITNKFITLTIIFVSVVYSQDESITDIRGKRIPESFHKPISLELSNVTFSEAIKRVAQAGNFHLNYNENIIPTDTAFSLSIKNKPAIIALKEILHGTTIDFILTESLQLVLVKMNSAEYNQSRRKFTISGYITDKSSGEALIGTNIFIYELNTGTTTNSYGFYSITVPEGLYTFRFSYIGFASGEYFTSLFNDVTLNIELSTESFEVDTVLVTSTFEQDFVQSTEMGTMHLNPIKLSTVPYLLGEKDILKTLHLLPGITFGREGDAGFYVRGGEFDQNLTLLDEAPVFSTFHLFGLFSVFNPDAIRNIKLIKGAAPPKYGGRLSSVLDIQMNEGNMKEFGGVAGIGFIFSRFTIEGPLVKDKSSFIVSGRRTYLDMFKLFTPDIDDLDFYFYDLNAKLNYKISNSDRIYLSGYFGNDALGFSNDFGMRWGNITGTLRWNHLFNDKLFLNTSLIYSRYKHKTFVNENTDSDEVSVVSKINDITLKQDYEYFYDTNNSFDFGLNYIYHSFLPGKISINSTSFMEFTIGKRNAHELSLYASHEMKFLEKFTIDYGLRSTMFSVVGEEDTYTFQGVEDIPVIDFHENESTTYFRVEPRISLNYGLDKSSSLKAGYAVNHQYLHMLSNAISGTPFDVWQSSSKRVKPQRSQQFSLGYFKSMSDNEYELSVETYYKGMSDIIDLRDGANLVLKNYFESELAFGIGWAYGIELYLRKNFGDITGWLGYALSKSERKIKEVNNGRPYPAKYDRTHDFSIVVAYKLGERWSLSANWVYSSGYNVTLPYGSYTVDGKAVDVFTGRNGYRLPAYHRMDLGLSYTNSLGGTWNFSVYNAYGHNNTYMVAVRNSTSGRSRKEAVALSIFSIVPSVSYTLRF